MTELPDEIGWVLRECEDTLRQLAAQRRLTDGALHAFVRLAGQVHAEMERRKGGDRRETPRPGRDRRTTISVPLPAPAPSPAPDR